MTGMMVKGTAMFVLACALLACGGSSGSGSGSTPITDEYVAESSIKAIARTVESEVLGQLSTGTFNSTAVNGEAGTARVTGTESSSQGVSCGTDCVRSTYSADVTIVFDNFTGAPYTNAKVFLNGTITYRESRTSTQQGLSYASTSTVSIQSSGQVEFREYDVDGTFSYADTVTFSASGSSIDLLGGSCTPGNGVTYTF